MPQKPTNAEIARDLGLTYFPSDDEYEVRDGYVREPRRGGGSHMCKISELGGDLVLDWWGALRLLHAKLSGPKE